LIQFNIIILQQSGQTI